MKKKENYFHDTLLRLFVCIGHSITLSHIEKIYIILLKLLFEKLFSNLPKSFKTPYQLSTSYSTSTKVVD